MKKKPVYSTDNKNLASSNAQSGVDTERDLDEQIHSHESEIGGDDNNEDPDDRVHKPQRQRDKASQLQAEDHPIDPDDLMHESDSDEDE